MKLLQTLLTAWLILTPGQYVMSQDKTPAYGEIPLPCATLTFSLPGAEYMNKIVAYEGESVIDADFGDIKTLTLKRDRVNKGHHYCYVSGYAPQKEGDFVYTVTVRNAKGGVRTVPIRLVVSNHLQSPTPAMSWLTWNWFSESISHDKLVDIAKGIKDKGLLDAGFNTIVIDDCWAIHTECKDSLDYDPEKFPQGMSGLSKALKGISANFHLGIYSDAGSQTCSGWQPGSYGYEERHLRMFDEWGIDMLKYDFCSNQAESYLSYEPMGRAIKELNEKRAREQRTPFVFNICEWGSTDPWNWAAQAGGSSWRATDDGRETWIGKAMPGVMGCCDRAHNRWMYAGVNRYNDLDMLCIGLHGLGGPSNHMDDHRMNGGIIPGLTDAQARSQMSLWCMLSSPLSLSCDLREHPAAETNKEAGQLPDPLITKADLATITNPEIIAIDQDMLGQQAEYMEALSTGKEFTDEGYDVFHKDLKGGRHAISVTNRSLEPIAEGVKLVLADLYLDPKAEYNCHEIWSGENTTVQGTLSTGKLEPCETKVFVIEGKVSKTDKLEKKYNLFNYGKSEYTIIVDQKATERVQFAAKELQDWIQQVSGATLPIEYDLNAGQPGKRLIVGYNALSRKLAGAKTPDGINDSFTYCSKGGDVCLWGDTDRGTLYAVYSLLERELGCRWFNSRSSLIPKCDSWSFALLNNHEVPCFRMRSDLYYDVYQHREFARKLRDNSDDLTYWSCHTLPGAVPVGKYFATHPEYFGEVKGKRDAGAQVCLSNPDVLKLAIEFARNAMRKDPHPLVYSISQGDGTPPCECAACNAIKAKYGNEESGIMVWFINQVADAVKDEFPDKFIGTFAYQHTRHAPQNIRPRNNVVIRLCDIECCQLHTYDDCKDNVAFRNDLQSWGTIAPHLYIWNYTTSYASYCLPLPNVWTFQTRLRYYRDNNVMGLMPEGSYQSINSAFEDMKAYVLSRLMWNPECNVDSVIEEFTDGYFGKAAGPIIRKYLNYERQIMVYPGNCEGVYADHNADIYKEPIIEPSRDYFERAKEATRKAGGDMMDEYIDRIEFAEVGIAVMDLMKHPNQGRANGSLDLLKRVIEKQGITIWHEFGTTGDIKDLLKMVQMDYNESVRMNYDYEPVDKDGNILSIWKKQ